jgi:hypothetical protein
MNDERLISVNELLYELNHLRLPHAQGKQFIPILKCCVATIDHYETENKALRAQLEQLKHERN